MGWGGGISALWSCSRILLCPDKLSLVALAALRLPLPGGKGSPHAASRTGCAWGLRGSCSSGALLLLCSASGECPEPNPRAAACPSGASWLPSLVLPAGLLCPLRGLGTEMLPSSYLSASGLHPLLRLHTCGLHPARRRRFAPPWRVSLSGSQVVQSPQGRACASHCPAGPGPRSGTERDSCREFRQRKVLRSHQSLALESVAHLTPGRRVTWRFTEALFGRSVTWVSERCGQGLAAQKRFSQSRPPADLFALRPAPAPGEEESPASLSAQRAHHPRSLFLNWEPDEDISQLPPRTLSGGSGPAGGGNGLETFRFGAPGARSPLVQQTGPSLPDVV